MTEAEWLACEDVTALLNFVLLDPLANGSARRNRLIACACARRVWCLLADERSRRAVETAERFVDGLAMAAELESAWAAASTEDNGGGIEEPPELAFNAPAAAAYAAAWNDQTAAVTSSVYAACALGLPRNDPWLNGTKWDTDGARERLAQVALLRDIFGNPFRPIPFSPSWRTFTVVALAAGMYESRDFGAMPILADALQDAGCDIPDILDHCRGGPHVRGCWVVDQLLEKA